MADVTTSDFDDYRIGAQVWCLSLFSLNVPIEALRHYADGEADFEKSLESAIDGDHGNLVASFPLLGIHDAAYLFKRSPPLLRQRDAERPSTIERISQWATRLTTLRAQYSGPATGIFTTPSSSELPRLQQFAEAASRASLGPDLHIRIAALLESVQPLGEIKYKLPALYNYTHDSLAPIYQPRETPTTFEQHLRTLNSDTSRICALFFLRVDPRLMRIAVDGITPDPWVCYNAVLERVFADRGPITTASRNIVQPATVEAVWIGGGTSQIVVLLSAASFLALAQARRDIRNNSCILETTDENRKRKRYPVVATSYTLLTVPHTDTFTRDISFSILVRMMSGYHNSETWVLLRKLAEECGICPQIDDFGERQGLFNLIINVRSGVAYENVMRYLNVLNIACPFIEDVATIVRYQGEPQNVA